MAVSLNLCRKTEKIKSGSRLSWSVSEAYGKWVYGLTCIVCVCVLLVMLAVCKLSGLEVGWCSIGVGLGFMVWIRTES